MRFFMMFYVVKWEYARNHCGVMIDLDGNCQKCSL